MKTITIVDYGVGNLQSLKKAFAYFGVTANVSEDAGEISGADALVLPGVGSFEAGMRGLRLRNLTDCLKKAGTAGKPILGICLGAQILLTEGYEFGVHKGLDIISGKVTRFPELPEGEKIPQVGWNGIYPPANVSWQGTIFDFRKSISEDKERPQMYFVHSYILVPERKEDIFGLTTYAGVEFCSIVKRANVIGVQFHPEKSGKLGLEIIGNLTRNF